MKHIDYAKDSDQQTNKQDKTQMSSPHRLFSPDEEIFVPGKQKYRHLVESAPLGIAVVGRTGRYLYLNPKFVEMFGYTPDDIPTRQEWFAKAYPDAAYRQQVVADWEIYLQQSEIDEAEPRLFTVTCKDGSTKVIKSRAVPLEAGEQFILYEDITELHEAEAARREAEELFRVLYECAADAFFLHDNGKILEVNQQSCDSLGYSREELLGMTISDIEVSLEPEELAEYWQQPFLPPHTVLGIQRRKDGSTFPVEVRASNFDHRGRKLRLALVRDISERVQTEAALKESELKYRTLVEQIPAITYMGPLGDFDTTTYLSPQIESVLGFSPADFANDPDIWQKQLHPDDRDRVLAEVVRCQKTGDPFDCEYRMLAKNGRTFWFHDKARLVPDPSNHHLTLQGVMLDITKRKELEQALQESETHYRTLFETSPDAILLFNPDMKLIMANTAAAALHGVERPEEMVGMSAFEFVSPESLALAQELKQEVKYKENLNTVDAEFVLLKKDGSPFLAETRTTILRNPDGSPQAFLAVSKDITERKRAEETLVQAKEEWERTFDAISDLVLILDDRYRIIRANRAMAHRLGNTPEEMVGQFCYQALHGLETPCSHCHYASLLINGKAAKIELWDEKMQGHFLLTMFPIYDPSGKIVGSVQVGTDITERKRAEEALRKSEEKYRLLVGQIPAVIFKGYEDWSIECFDDKIETLTGYSKEDFNSRRLTWRDLIPEDELPYVKKIYNTALKGDGSYFREHRIRKKTGEYAWVQCRGQIFKDDQGRVDHISGVTFDITSRKKGEAAFRKSEERYRLIAENVSDVIWTVDMDLRVTYISPSIQQLLGYAPEEILCKPIGEILPPASLGRALEVLSEEMAREELGFLDPKRFRVVELDECHKDGTLIRTEVKASFIRGPDNQPRGILGVTRDITKRKHVEDALRRREAILEAVSFGAEKFLKTHFWEQDIQEVLARLGQAVQVSRIYIFENHADKNGTLLASLRHEWVAANVKLKIETSELKEISYKEAGFERWEEMLSRGQIIWGHVADFPAPEQTLLAARDTKSVVAVPIFVGQQWWGGISFEDCIKEREWSSMEIDALLTAASILGLTILHHTEERALRESEEKLRSLSYQLLTAQEQERKRLSSELHNVLGHDLLLLKLKLESIREELGPEHPDQGQKVLRAVQALQDSVSNVRRLCQDLTPGNLEDLGMSIALQLLVENFALARKLTWQTKVENLDDLFDVPVQTAIYRMVQEALTNIGKHAQARHVRLLARRSENEVAFVIEDDGQGFDVAEALASKKTLGLLAMEERVKILGGTFDIVSRAQAGTKIIFTIPIYQRKDLQ